MNPDTCIHIDLDELKNAPLKTNNPNNPDANNGLITSIWGPHEWESFHSKTFGYPINPTDEEKFDYLQYFICLGNVLPCIHCRRSYKIFINESDTLLDMSVMESRESLTKWGHRLHNAVNNKLGVDYGETYEELCYKFESYRAKCTTNTDKTKIVKGCIMPLDVKAKSYQKADIRRAPIIDKKYSIALSDYAKSLGMKNYDAYVEYYSSLLRNSVEWTVRDCSARKIIKIMKKNGINALTNEELPSIHEMMLISMLSSTLDKTKLDDILNKILSNSRSINTH